MRFQFAVLVTAGLLLHGCGGKPNESGQSTNAATSSGSALTAPVDYLGTVVKARQNADKTISKVDTETLNQAVTMFNVDNGRNPKSLNELVPRYVPRLPNVPADSEFVYDPSSGRVQLSKKAAPAPAK